MVVLDILDFDNYFTGSLESNIEYFHGSKEAMWVSSHYRTIEYHYLYGTRLREHVEQNFLKELSFNPVKWLLFISFLSTMRVFDKIAISHLAFATERGTEVIRLALVRIQNQYRSLIRRYGDIDGIHVTRRGWL